MATIILADGTRLSNLEVNGDNYLSDTEITSDIFDSNTSPVIIDTEDGRAIHDHMELVQITHPDNKWWFVLRDLSENELSQIKIRGDIDYIAMMVDVDLDEL